MADGGRGSTGALVAIAVVAGVVLWVALRPDPGEVDRARVAPEAHGVGPVQAVTGPTVTVTSSAGDSTGEPSGTVAADAILVDVDGDTLTATSLIDGEPVWSYGREDEEIDRWTVSGDAVWVLFDDDLLVRVNVGAARVADSTVFDELGDDVSSMTGDGLGGVVLQGSPDASESLWWVGSDLDPVALDLPDGCKALGDVSSDGERTYLLALCADDMRRVAAFESDGGSPVWAGDPTMAGSLEVDRGNVVVHEPGGSVLLDPQTGEFVARVPPAAPGYSYLSAADGLFVAWDADAPASRPSLVVWSVDRRGVVWRLPGSGRRGSVSAPLLSDGHVYYTQTTYGDEPTFRLVVVNLATGGATSTELATPDPAECEGGSTEFRPEIEAGIPGGIVVGWEDDDLCSDPVLEVYAGAG
jgi:hypothetical protein